MFTRIRPYIQSLLQAIVVLFVLSLLADWWRKPEAPQTPDIPPLTAINGQTLDLQQLSRDQVAVMYFWGSWCDICRYTSPAVETLHQNGTPVVAIAVQSGSDADIQSYMQQHGLSFPTVNQSSQAWPQQWQIAATPTFVFMKNGRVVHTSTGWGSYWGLKSRVWLSAWL